MRLQSHLLWWSGWGRLCHQHHTNVSYRLHSFDLFSLWNVLYMWNFVNLHLRAMPSILFPYFIPNSFSQGPCKSRSSFLLSSNPHPQDTEERAFALPQDPRVLIVYITSSESVRIQPVSSLSLQGGLSGRRHPESCSPDVWCHIRTVFSGTA